MIIKWVHDYTQCKDIEQNEKKHGDVNNCKLIIHLILNSAQ